MNYEELESEFVSLCNKLKRFEDRVGYDAENVDAPGNANERQLYDTARHIVDKLYDVKWELSYLKREILWEGTLTKQSNGRYNCGTDGSELTSGSSVEVYIQEDDTWELTAVEHNGNDYYIKTLGVNTPINGVRARVRG